MMTHLTLQDSLYMQYTKYYKYDPKPLKKDSLVVLFKNLELFEHYSTN